MKKAIRPAIFKWRQTEPELILCAVRWYLRYSLSFRDVEDLLAEVGTVISALCAVAEPVKTRFLWRPQLRDPADEMVLEAAINGNADALVTFNQRDFSDAPGRFEIAMLSPQEALRRISA